jgi:tRNA-5-methyluridine54 2-sulfurtransferase
MKCRVCGRQAVIALRAYSTAFCEEDFVSFLENRVFTTIQKYRLIESEDRPIVAVSGGKDSLSLWQILHRLGYPADGLYIDLGITGYSEESLEKTRQMAKKLDKKLYIFHVGDSFRQGIDALSASIRRPACSTCGTIKRYIMNRVCMDKAYSVVVTGHNIDDEAAALFGNLLYWKKEYLWKKNIVMDKKEGHLSKKVKPLFLCSEKEMAAYAIISGIDYIYEECPFSADAKSLLYKGILNKIEDLSPATKIRFVKGYLSMVRRDAASPDEGDEKCCTICGYPCYGERCTICGLLDRFGVKKEIEFEEYDNRP